MSSSVAVQASPPGRLGARFHLFMAGYSVSCLGSGLILPFTAIYIDSYLRLGPGHVAIFFAVLAITSIASGLLGGRMVDQLGHRVPGVLGAGGMGAGYLILALANSGALVPVSAAVVGIGTGLFHPAFIAAAAAIAPESLRRRVFAMRHLVMNVGLGIGAAVGAVLAPGAETFRLLFVFNAFSYVPLAAALWWVVRSAAPAQRSAGAESASGYRLLVRSRPLLLLCITQLLISLVGFAQLGSAVPLLIHGPMGETTRVVGVVVVANTVAVVVLQYPLARLFELISDTATLALTAVIWIAAYGCGALAAMASGTARHTLLLAFPVLFAAGEAAYASSFFAMLTRMAPAGSLGRASAVATQAFGVGSIVGPAIGVLVVAHLGAIGSWLCLAAGAALPLATASMLAPAQRRQRDGGQAPAGEESVR